MTSRPLTVIASLTLAVLLADIGVAIGRSASHHGTPHTGTAAVTGPATSATPAATGPTATTSPAPDALAMKLDQAFRLALAQHTAHSVARNVAPKLGTEVFDDYDGIRIGSQHITINGGHIDIRVVGPTTYLNGDTKGLAVYGFKQRDVKALHGQWLSLVAGQAGYASITSSITLASTLEADRIGGTLTEEPAKTINGQQVYGISGDGVGGNSPHRARATMWISKSTGLPVEFDASNGHSHVTETFSEWGKPIHVAAPANVYGQPGLAS